ncbi:metal ABC transporter solute-binding protein, Zn/Mn family [Phaeodactylibacter xiamenensis]|uniref:metal ABC transporter solute-binding protein, Zn/Mn family n=1 Tax=Phaeodactylibacter xiamenensis TaxID=1524460 RepID=UPI0024A8B45D|nr:zinc ABC transporter substrate-binding protein [Phaeodactylibacter xiamenensis]
MSFVKSIMFLLCLLALCGCEPPGTTANTDDSKLQIIATTGMIADALEEIVGDQAEVTALMGPGVDPHLYKATQGDLKRLTDADAVFYNGLHLEGKMGEVLEKLARLKPVVAVADQLPEARLINSTDYASAHDPHVWFDVSLWSEAAGIIGAEMGRIDPPHAKLYQANAKAYQEKLSELHLWVAAEIRKIPETQRVLITAHDAFEYFGQAYDIEVRGLQGISTVSEFGLRDVSELVDFITGRGIKAVFVESSVPEKSLQAVVEGVKQRGHTTKIGGTLYSDAMGAEGTAAGTYPGMVQANVRTIVEALR